MRLPLSQSAPAVGIAAAAGPAGSHAAPRGLTGASSRSSVRPMGSRAHVGCSGVATCGCVGGAGGRARQQLQMRRLWAPTPALQPLRRSQAPLSRGMAVVAAAKGVGKPKKDDSEPTHDRSITLLLSKPPFQFCRDRPANIFTRRTKDGRRIRCHIYETMGSTPGLNLKLLDGLGMLGVWVYNGVVWAMLNRTCLCVAEEGQVDARDPLGSLKSDCCIAVLCSTSCA